MKPLNNTTMKSFSLSTIAGLTMGLLLVGYTVLAWSVPSQSAPNGNATPPLNTGSTAQTRAGDLTLQGDVVSQNKTIWGDDVTLGKDSSKGITQCGDLKLNDNSASPIQKVAFHACDAIVGSFRGIVALFDNSGTQQIALNPQDKTIQAGIVTVKGDGSISPNLNSSKLQDLDAASLMAAGGSGGGGSYVAWGTSSCAAGWAPAYTGYLTSNMVLLAGSSSWVGGNVFCKAGAAYPQTINAPYQYFVQQAYYRGSYSDLISCAMCVTAATAPPLGSINAGSTLIYATKAAYEGSLGGRSGADDKCSADLPSALSGHVKTGTLHAFLSTSTTDEIRDMHTNDSDNDSSVKGWYQTAMPIYAYNREWAKYTNLADTWQALLSGSIAAPTSNTRDNSYNPFSYWTGSSQNGSTVSDTDYNCGGFNLKPGKGVSGYSGGAGVEWLYYQTYDNEGAQLPNPNCTSFLRLLCAFQYQ